MSYNRLLKQPRQSFFLFGPRGSGKSTWIRENVKSSVTIDLLNQDVFSEFLLRPRLLADRVRSLKAGSWVVIDEVQKIPALLNEVHSLIENQRLNFVLSGSSSRQLRRSGTNLLAGRALQKQMFPFLPVELGNDFNLDQVLQFGTMPIVWSAQSKAEVLKAYTQTYLREEIQAEALVRNLQGFARFLPIASLFHGQVLNTSNIAREAGVARTTVVSYLEILEDTLLAFKLSAFEAKLRVKERRNPKFYFVDPGLVRSLMKKTSSVTNDEKGFLFEGFIASSLRAVQSYQDQFDDMFYWASTESNVEIDFLLKRGNEWWAVEAKSSRTFHSSMAHNFSAIDGLKGLKRKIIIYAGSQSLKLESRIEVLPVEKFFETLAK